MKTLLLYFAFVLIYTSAGGQEHRESAGSKHVYTVVDTFIADISSLILNPESIKAIQVMKGEEAMKLYGDKGRDGALLITTKPNTVMLRIKDIVEKFKIPKSGQQLRVCINNVIVEQPQLLLVEEKQIVKVEVTTEHIWVNAEDANTGEKFINIKTSESQKREL